ncbi:hypothetical protein ILYODFUR_002571 [Ilyodon furcidens]|uniref:Uncharacterized protein n=1 Tax=Ilyodon furcidens TaxID=33524 RepID=A0ABV0UCS5_9TELE
MHNHIQQHQRSAVQRRSNWNTLGTSGLQLMNPNTYPNTADLPACSDELYLFVNADKLHTLTHTICMQRTHKVEKKCRLHMTNPIHTCPLETIQKSIKTDTITKHASQ